MNNAECGMRKAECQTNPGSRVTRLLVSVRSGPEAEDALAGGADLIDIKEPSRGSLGMADLDVWRNVAEVVAGRAPLSAALGELSEYVADCEIPADSNRISVLNAFRIDGMRKTQQATPAIQFAKVGLAGVAARSNWQRGWAELLISLPLHVHPVAVCYADWRTAFAPPPDHVVEIGSRLGCVGLLIDTYEKRRGGLLDLVSNKELELWVDQARRLKMLVVVAGSLTADSVRQILPLSPDFVAVRGAVCRDGREGVVDPLLVRELAILIGSGAEELCHVERRRVPHP